ncbi:MAG: hypothetical protein LBC18_15030 [Opitutaceae bacterium]|jgi:hypothetical protein|nr:hypothetical protein [Opitutaceae bacterium]
MPAALVNASARPLAETGGAGLPFVGGAMTGWFRPLTAGVVTKAIVDFEAVETVAQITFRGVRQPLNPKRLDLKPEGQRAWKWDTLHCEPSLKLKNDDVVMLDGTRHRVMNVSDFSEYGYMYYEIAEDFAPPPPAAAP